MPNFVSIPILGLISSQGLHAQNPTDSSYINKTTPYIDATIDANQAVAQAHARIRNAFILKPQKKILERKANFVSIAFGSSEGTRSQFTIDQLLQFTDALDSNPDYDYYDYYDYDYDFTSSTTTTTTTTTTTSDGPPPPGGTLPPLPTRPPMTTRPPGPRPTFGLEAGNSECEDSSAPTCDSSYPPVNGECRGNGQKGKSMTPYNRLVPPNYCTGVRSDQPRCSENPDAKLPSERAVSRMMRVGHVSGGFQIASLNSFGDVSNAFTAWGQYIIHDILQTPDVHNDPETPAHFTGCKCTPDDEKDDKFFNFCHQIEFPDFREGSDPVLDTVPCIFVTRSQAQLIRTGPNSAIREQINQLTSFIDGTTIYGVTSKHLNLLLEDDRMHLRMQKDGESADKHGHLLPALGTLDPLTDLDLGGFGNVTTEPDNFVAGDTRVQEFPVLTSFHTVMARLHNDIATKLHNLNKRWCPEKVFNEARLIVMAINQHITYTEHLPLLLGEKAMKFVDDADENSVEPVTDGPSLSDPSVRNEFAVAGYRWGHAQLMDEFNIADENLNFQEQIDTVDTFFNPDTVYDKGPAGCLRGAMQRFTGKVSGVFWPTFQDNLFRGAGADHGSDLLSFNIARGREHGVGTYLAVRRWCQQHPIFKSLYDGPVEMLQGWEEVLALYDSVEDVDLYVGLLMEDHTNGAMFGPTNQCVNAEQFIGLKKGDKFFYTNKKPGQHVFPKPGQLEEIQKTGLAKVFCTQLGKNAQTFKFPFMRSAGIFKGEGNAKISCEGQEIDLSAWKEPETKWGEWNCQECSNSCGGGAQVCTRECENGEAGDPGCEGSSRKSETCNEQDCPEWSDWVCRGECSKTCGSGKRPCTRKCLNGEKGDKGCEGRDEKNEDCNTQKCPPPQDPVEWSNWSEWSDCTKHCNGGSRSRTRDCLNGPGCKGDSSEDEPCNTDPCPACSSWEEWGECSKPCNGGKRNRARTCHDEDGNRSRDRESEDCNTIKCPCKLSEQEWSEWSDCTVTCGNGERQRERSCDDDDKEIQIDICKNPACAEWGDWECPKCSKTCGGGFQLCTRTCIGGEPGDPGCPGPDREPRQCNSQKCPVKWGEWKCPKCSKTCGGGFQLCERKCIGGQPGDPGCSGSDHEQQPCNIQICPGGCSLGSAMESKDAVVSELPNEIPTGLLKHRLVTRWFERVFIGVMDKRNWPEEKNEYACAKKLSEKVPDSVLPGCGFEEGSTAAETIANICDGMENVLEWAYQGCYVKGSGNNRAIRTMEKLNQLCGNMKKKFPILPTPPPNSCPYQGKNKICDGSDKCGLSHFGACVQLETMAKNCRQQEVGMLISNIMAMLSAASEPFEAGKCRSTVRFMGFRAIFPDVKDVPECTVAAGAVPCDKFQGLSGITDPMQFHDLVFDLHKTWTSKSRICNAEFGVHFSAYLSRLKNAIKNC